MQLRVLLGGKASCGQYHRLCGGQVEVHRAFRLCDAVNVRPWHPAVAANAMGLQSLIADGDVALGVYRRVELTAGCDLDQGDVQQRQYYHRKYEEPNIVGSQLECPVIRTQINEDGEIKKRDDSKRDGGYDNESLFCVVQAEFEEIVRNRTAVDLDLHTAAPLVDDGIVELK